MDQIPQRIGDAERDAAIVRLRAAHSEGRLTLDEFDERMNQALQAKTQADIDPLFYDLPSDAALAIPQAPAAALAANPAPADVPAVPTTAFARVVQAISVLIWPVALITCFATDWHLWWIILIPVFLMPALWSLAGGDPNERADRRNARRR